MLRNLIYYRTTHNDGVRIFSDKSHLLWIGNTKSDGNRQIRMRPDFGNLRRKIGRHLRLHSRYAFARDIIDKSAAALDDKFHAVFRRRRCHKINMAKTGFFISAS